MKRLMCLLLAVALLISSIRNCRIDVYADEEETTAEAGTGERGGGVHEVCTDDNFIGYLSDFANHSVDSLEEGCDYIITTTDEIGNQFVERVENYLGFFEFLGSEMLATSADLYVNSMEYVSDQIGDIGDKVKVFFDGKNLAYSVDSDLQQAIYDALMQYTATQTNAVYLKPTGTISKGYLTDYWPSQSYFTWTDEIPVFCIYKDPGFAPYFGTLDNYGQTATFYNTGNTSGFSGSRIFGYYSNSYQGGRSLWSGPCILAYYSVSDALNALSDKSPAYINTDWSPSGTQYITNDGLNYDWAARNSRNYSTLVNAITDGTIDGQTMINNTLVDMSSDLDDIRETINEVSDDVSESADILQNIYELLMKYLPLLEDIKDSPSKILDGTSDSSVLNSIKKSVNQILGLMYYDQLTDLLDEYLGDDDDKDSYVEKSIGYVLLVLLIFQYLMKIFMHLLAFIVAFFNIEPALCSDFLPDEVYQGFQYLDEIMIPYLNMSVWDFEQLILYTVMIFYCIRLFVRYADRFKFD